MLIPCNHKLMLSQARHWWVDMLLLHIKCELRTSVLGIPNSSPVSSANQASAGDGHARRGPLPWPVEGSSRHSYTLTPLPAAGRQTEDLGSGCGDSPSPAGSACCLWETAVSSGDHIRHKGWSVSRDIAALYGGLFWKACANTRSQEREESELESTCMVSFVLW